MIEQETKVRSMSVYCPAGVHHWTSEKQFYIDGLGSVNEADAIEENLRCFFSKNAIAFLLDIARTMGTVDDLFRTFLEK